MKIKRLLLTVGVYFVSTVIFSSLSPKNVFSINLVEESPQYGFWSKTINYVTWDETYWKASLEDLHWITGPFGIWNVSDPDFQHQGSHNHNDDFIDYISDAGEKWRAKVHAHSNLAGRVWFTFEHFRAGNEKDK